MPQYENQQTYTESIPLEPLEDQTKSAMEVDSRPATGSTAIEDVEDPLLEQEIRNFRHSQKSKFQRVLIRLWNGPDEPKDTPPARIKALGFLEKLAERFQAVSKRIKVTCLAAYLIFWFLCVLNILSPYFTVPPHVDGDKHVKVLSLGCTDQLWKGKNAACGLDGQDCLPGNTKDVFIRCPALCDRSWTYSLEPIGDQRIKYRGYFVGGGDEANGKWTKDQLSNPYRADSYVCGSAVHAGIMSPFTGGCARLSYSSGEQSGFESKKGHYGVDDSIAFPSFFPASFYFKNLVGQKNQHFHQCHDPRLPILVMNIFLGLPIVYLGSGHVIFWTINTVGFWTIALATDPPVKVDSNDLESYASLLSTGLERFLPVCFILYALWNFSTKCTLYIPEDETDKVSYLSRVLYFYPLFWLGVLNNISFDRLPVDRFTIEDLKQQPGGAIAVSCIVLLVVTCAIIQAYKIWQAGKFKKYLIIYMTFLTGLLMISQLPGLTLRVHHYILAMLLIPGCCTRGVTAMMFQGILLGLFLSGAARWGLAAIAETDTSLRRNDPSGKILPPELLAFDVSSGLLTWSDVAEDGYNGISVLINDVERYVASNVTSVNLQQLITNSSDLSHMISQSLKSKFVSGDNTIPLYIRIGKKIMGTNKYSDYTNAATLIWPKGELKLPEPGIT